MNKIGSHSRFYYVIAFSNHQTTRNSYNSLREDSSPFWGRQGGGSLVGLNIRKPCRWASKQTIGRKIP